MERDKTYQLQPPRNPPGQRVGHGESGLGTYDVSHERVVRVGLGHELLTGSQQPFFNSRTDTVRQLTVNGDIQFRIDLKNIIHN